MAPLLLALAVAWSGASAPGAQEKVAETVHNLSSGGPGHLRSSDEGRVCVFCHTPHSGARMTPLWNRQSSVTNYKIYTSSTLDAHPSQPSGSSKLCLSCHDGTIALGSVLNDSDRIRMAGGEFVPSGLSNIGTDLSDDHPISFPYHGGLAAADRQLRSPGDLSPEVKLDNHGRLQCITCHDPHDNSFSNFLVIDNREGALCTSCHRMDGWLQAAHSTSSATLLGKSGVHWTHTTVAENACASCHRPHASGSKELLLIYEREEDNCLVCHDGTVARTNIRGELGKRSAHDPRRYLGTHDPQEVATGHMQHVECSDCHNPHAVTAETGARTLAYTPIGATLTNRPGVNIAGAGITEAAYEYEICLRCHGDSPVRVGSSPNRQADTDNLRLKFSPSSASSHPVTEGSRSLDTVSLAPGIAQGSLIRCTDCHNNDTGPGNGGSGPDGPHGSSFPFLLERNYTVRDETIEFAFEYDLCYKCHQRESILGDVSFPEHRRHIVDERTPCSACHDPHGIDGTRSMGSDHTHLINFDTIIVRPEASSGRLEFKDLGRFQGSCTLSCHGTDHVDLEYGTPGASRRGR